MLFNKKNYFIQQRTHLKKDAFLLPGINTKVPFIIKEVYIPTLHGHQREKTCFRGVANNKCTGQPAHLYCLISTFVICLLESIISRLATGEFSIF